MEKVIYNLTKEKLKELPKVGIAFGKGIGDIFVEIRKNKTYQILNDLRENQKAVIYLDDTCNPFCEEYFKFHPKRNQFEIVKADLTTLPALYLGKEDCPLIVNYITEDKPYFYRKYIYYPHFHHLEPYVVLNFGAGLKDRNIPYVIAQEIVSALHKEGIKMIAIGKSYEREGYENFDYSKLNGGLDYTDKFNVPETIHLIKNSIGVVTAHTAPILFAWEYRKPNLLVLPHSIYYHENLDFQEPNRLPEAEDFHKETFTFGRHYEESTIMLFENYNKRFIQQFINKLK